MDEAPPPAIITQDSPTDGTSATQDSLPPPQQSNNDSANSLLEEFQALKEKPWTVPLNFKGHYCGSLESCPPAGDSLYQAEHDLLSLTDKQYSHFILRFDPGLYPPDAGSIKDQNNQSLDQLKRDIFKTCSDNCGFSLTSNGFKPRGGGHTLRICCSRRHFSKQNKKYQLAPGSLRKHSLSLNKKNQRKGKRKGEGLSLKRGTSPSMPVKEDGDCSCNLEMRIGLDTNSFYPQLYQCHYFRPCWLRKLSPLQSSKLA